jgi:hypothetical protein
MTPFARGLSSVLDITASALEDEHHRPEDEQDDAEVIANDWTIVGELLTSAIYGSQSNARGEAKD